MKTKLFIFLLMVVSFVSCQKNTQYVPTFNVSTPRATYNAGDTVVFNMEGDAGVVSFYSGEFSNDYAYKDGRILTIDGLNLSFLTRVQFGGQPNQLGVMISNDFNGDYTIESIHNANWTDITSRFVLATSTTNVQTTPQNIADLMEEGRTMYLAYRYKTVPQTSTTLARTWTVGNTSLTTTTLLGTTVIADQKTAAWTLVNTPNVNDPGRSVISTAGTLTLRGNITTNLNVETETWAVSKAFDLANVDMGPDKAVPIKNTLDNRLESYSHVYTKPGIYKVVFVSSNVSTYEQKSVVKELTIEILEAP